MGDSFEQGPGRKGISGRGEREVLDRRNNKDCKALMKAVFIVNRVVYYFFCCMK